MDTKKSIMEMGRGAFTERVDYEMAKVIENILDANTKATAKRKITVTLEFSPDDDRENISVNVTAKSTLAPTNAARTNLFVCGNEIGEVAVVEMVPQVPGQQTMDGGEQEAPATLKVIKFAQ